MKVTCLLLITALALCAGCQPIKPVPPSHTVVFQTLPERSAPALTAATLDLFVDWLLTMPGTSRDSAVAAIDAAASDPNVVNAVLARVSFAVAMSYERRLVLLATVGEMQKASAVPVLIAFIQAPECPVFEERAKQPGSSRQTEQTTYFDGCAGLKSQAASMLAHIPEPEADRAILEVVRTHPSRAVRLSAIDAYLFNHQDSADARARLTQVVKAGDAVMLDAIRLTPDSTPTAVAKALTEFYHRHPDALPPAPPPLTPNAPPPTRHEPNRSKNAEHAP